MALGATIVWEMRTTGDNLVEEIQGSTFNLPEYMERVNGLQRNRMTQINEV